MGGFGAFQVGGFSPVSRLSSWTELEGLRWFGMARDCQATFDAVVSVAGYGLGTLEEGERSDLVSGEKCLGLQGFCPAGEGTPQPEARERFEQFLDQALSAIARSNLGDTERPPLAR